MPRLRVLCYSVSLDGFGAGTGQRLDQPLGFRGPEMFQWFFPTRTWRAMQGQEVGETGVDDAMAAKGFEGIGAWIMGRNMFGPVRGPWPDESAGRAGGRRAGPRRGRAERGTPTARRCRAGRHRLRHGPGRSVG